MNDPARPKVLRRKGIRLLATAIAVGTTVGLLTSATAAASPLAPLTPQASATPPPPSQDPFYQAPTGFAATVPGTILRTRQVTVKDAQIPVSGAAFTAYQLLYRTNDATGHPVANVTTVMIPTTAAPAGGRNLLSIADPEDSIDWNCAPSYQLRTGENAPAGDGAPEPDIATNLTYEIPFGAALSALRNGADVVIPDHEGPNSEYLVSGMEGHAALDSIRAVEHFSAAGLSAARTKVGMVGYSGGAHVVAAAGELQPAYAPELNIVGVAAGGVPIGNEAAYSYFNGGVAAGVIMPLLIALDRAYPFGFASLLNANGQAFAKQVAHGCASPVFEAPFVNFNQYTTVPDIFSLPKVAKTIARNALGQAVPTAPTFFYNGIRDEIVWIKPIDDTVNYYCQHRAQVDYYRDPAGNEHVQDIANFYPLALDYLNSRFSGAPIPDTCGMVNNAGPPPVAAP